mmetsp:Transcript_120102/g.339860  ORF Transcript_120102/g.339860 Transcript_120102/m.339860 type:complete len:208 (-) Transcript_120102:94-717(-)
MASAEIEETPCDDDSVASTGLLQNTKGCGACGWWTVLLTYVGGGTIVCATYAWGAAVLADPSALWGRLRDPSNAWLLHVYYVSIALATLGYFPSLAYALHVAPTIDRARLQLICGLFAGFFVASCFWMPLCVAYLANKSLLLFVCLRVQLASAGVLGLGWAAALCSVGEPHSSSAGPPLCMAGRIGTFFFAFHCAVFDAILWPPFFR